MNSDKFLKYVSYLQTEDRNLSKSIKELRSRFEDLEHRVTTKRIYMKILYQIRDSAIEARLLDKEELVLALTLSDGPWNNITDARTSVDVMLREVGAKGVRIESINQFRVRKPLGEIIGREFDTVISLQLCDRTQNS